MPEKDLEEQIWPTREYFFKFTGKGRVLQFVQEAKSAKEAFKLADAKATAAFKKAQILEHEIVIFNRM